MAEYWEQSHVMLDKPCYINKMEYLVATKMFEDNLYVLTRKDFQNVLKEKR